MATVQVLVPVVGVGAACTALNVPRSGYYRAQQPPSIKTPGTTPKAPPPRALSVDETSEKRRSVNEAVVRATLNSERFQDAAPREVYASLLDEGTYLCSVRGMYRILAENDELRERRAQRRHPVWSSRSWWRPDRTNSGAGTLPACRRSPLARFITYT